MPNTTTKNKDEVRTKSDKIAEMENTNFFDDKNVMVDPMDAEIIYITDRLCHKKHRDAF
jgi:hypothetical protein